jgi:hypothetical protein
MKKKISSILCRQLALDKVDSVTLGINVQNSLTDKVNAIGIIIIIIIIIINNNSYNRISVNPLKTERDINIQFVFHFSISSRPALGFTQPPIKWAPGALSGGKAAGA